MKNQIVDVQRLAGNFLAALFAGDWFADEVVFHFCRAVFSSWGERDSEIRDREQKGYDRSSWQAGLIFPYGVVQLQLPQSLGSTTGNVPDPPASDSSHTCASAATRSCVSLHDNRFPNSALRHSAQTIFTPIFKNQGNRSRQISPAVFDGATLAVCARYFGTVTDEPFSVLLNDGSKFVMHAMPP
jgi:hypothetical protein